MRTDLVKGFRDFLGDEAKKREEIRKILVDTFEKYAFNPAETPIIEYEEFVKGENEKDEAVSDIYRLTDKGDRKLALRYEFTFQLKRIMMNQKLPFRRYSIGPVFRDEPTGGNRLRQFVQCDADIIGSNQKDEAEIFAMAKKLLNDLKIPFIIYVNNRKLLNEILDKAGVKEEDKREVIIAIDKLDKISEEEVKKELERYTSKDLLEIFKQKEKAFEKYDAYKEIAELKKYCEEYGVKVDFLPTLARGLSYYNGTIFEIKTEKMKETITAGGAYLFNNAQCFGISFGLDRLAMLAEMKVKNSDYLVVSIEEDKKAIELLSKLREKGMSCQIYYGKPSKALAYADAYKFSGVIFVGADEVKKKEFKVKDMVTGKEKILTLEKRTKKNIIVKRKEN